MKLYSVAVSGFRSIEGPAEIQIGSPTILAGHNDAGKTALLDAISFLLGEYEMREADRTILSQAHDNSPEYVDCTTVLGIFTLSETEQESLELPAIVTIRRTFHATAGSSFEIETEVPEDEDLRDLDSLKVEQLKSRLDSRSLDSTGLKGVLIARLRSHADHLPTVRSWIALPAAVKRSLPRVQRFDAISSQDPEAAVRNALQTSYRTHLEAPDVQGDVESITRLLEARIANDAIGLKEHIQSNCAGIDDIEIRPTIRLDGGLKFTEVRVRNERGELVGLGRSGTGKARRIALAVWEYNANLLSDSEADTILLYDEPDTHLDYRHQRSFADLLERQSAFSNVSIVVATHSMNLIDGVDIADVHHVRQKNSRTQIGTLPDDSETGKHLGSIAAGLGLRNTVLLHERLFVGVEGETEARALPVLFKFATGRQLESCGIALWPCNNNDGALRFAQFLVKNNRNVAMLLDCDSLRLKVFSQESLARHGLSHTDHVVTLGTINEFEDAFSDELWANCANMNWRRKDQTDWTPSQFATLREGKFSSKLLTLLKEEGSESPDGKPQMMTQLAWSLKTRSDIPADISEAFQTLIRLAKGSSH